MSIKINVPRSAELICGDILEVCNQLCENSNIPYSLISGIGAACPGHIKDGVVISAPNLKFENVKLEEILSEKSHKKCSVCNYANAAALGEYVKGTGK